METTTKVCSKCGRELPHESFSHNPRNADGRMAVCKECLTAARNARRNKERVEKTAPIVVEESEVVKSEVHPKPTTEAVDTLSVNEAPYNTIEIPASGWLAYVPDDILYGELINRGWRGSLSKTLASA